MKKILLLALPIFCILFAAFIKPIAAPEIYTVDAQAGKVEWLAEKLTGKHNGTIKILDGRIENNKNVYKGVIHIGMTSIEDKDIASADYKLKLEKHLKSADFFDSEKYPKSTFVITSIKAFIDVKPGGPTHTVTGNLTIKDKTNEITFPAIIKTEGKKMTCTGSMVVDRSKFDVRYGSKTFFEDIGDKMIYDNFTLNFDLTANK